MYVVMYVVMYIVMYVLHTNGHKGCYFLRELPAQCARAQEAGSAEEAQYRGVLLAVLLHVQRYRRRDPAMKGQRCQLLSQHRRLRQGQVPVRHHLGRQRRSDGSFACVRLDCVSYCLPSAVTGVTRVIVPQCCSAMQVW